MAYPFGGSASKSSLSKLCTLQNKAVKIIDGGNYRDHATQFYAKLKILKISNLFKHEVAKAVFQHYRQNLPPLLSNFFTKCNQISLKSARASDPNNNLTLHIPLYRTSKL